MIEARALLQALDEAQPVSGSALAARFGVSRAAVWKQMEALREKGAPIEAAAGSGYRLRGPLALLDEDAIRAAMSDSARSRLESLEVHWQIDSTNSALSRRVQAGDSGPGACFAEIQTAGRGRRGRRWHMPLGGGLAFSIWRRFDAGMASMAGLSLAVGIGVMRALERLGYHGIGLKWPNDIQHRGLKLGGILVELGGDALGPCHAVVGIGLNLRIDAAAGGAIDQPWTDLVRIGDGAPADRNRIAACLLEHLLEALECFAQSSFAAFADEYARYDVLRGKPVRVTGGGGERCGEAAGVDRHGALLLRTADGELRVDSGEVSVRPQSGSAS
ncbi:biotin--[acetyl-CoA-carboxylase] ligase [Dokdonella immobilis]|uniref:Bifunctional ligase/repressor BirA n=1 Tax=Dokdonella immobilis TaxID=578942 RepID=A0A1I4VKB3_9GAMM|nr:biotin--[acetyl-CoA-carboxylase] ligase [Dokdonella immobilis]SFN01560.1 BirA family transcriptional regulator, biotin operon repressor / biotin-[acetyl-CoA-carboxylase] ligase [Dokdonella immobilis]